MVVVGSLEPIGAEEAKNGYHHLLKGIIVGPAFTGKSSLLQRFTSDSFQETYTETIGVDFAVKTFRSGEGENLKVQLWDTAGQQRFRTITNSYYRGTHGIMLVFDVGDDSFEEMDMWHQEIQQFTIENTPVILVGNKVDGDRKISTEQAETYAKENGLIYVESSAKTGDNVFKAFQVFIEEMLRVHKERRATVKGGTMTKAISKKIEGKKENSSTEEKKGPQKSKSCTII